MDIIRMEDGYFVDENKNLLTEREARWEINRKHIVRLVGFVQDPKRGFNDDLVITSRVCKISADGKKVTTRNTCYELV